MANPTSNYNWQMPTNTDLVKDLPADFEVFGQAVDTTVKSIADGRVLKSDFDAKGDILIASGNDAYDNLTVGTNNFVLTADSTQTLGVKWAAVPDSMTLLSTTTLSGASTTISSINGTYRNLQIDLENVYSVTDAVQLLMRFNSDTGSNYSYYTFSVADGAAAGGAQTSIQLSKVRNSSTTGAGTIIIPNYASTVDKALLHTFNYSDQNTIFGGSAYGTTSAISSITFLMSSGNLGGGTVKIYGVK